MDVDLDDAGIGRDLDDVEARIGRRIIAFDLHRHAGLLSRLPRSAATGPHSLPRRQRRHENANGVAARLDRQRGAHRAGDLRRESRLRRWLGGFKRHDTALAAAGPCARAAAGTGSSDRAGSTCGLIDRLEHAGTTAAAAGSRRASRPAPGRDARGAAPSARSPSGGRDPPSAKPVSAERNSRRWPRPRSNTRAMPLALGGIVELVGFGGDVDRQLPLDEQEVRRIFVGRDGAIGRKAELRCRARASASRHPRSSRDGRRSR